MYFWQQPIWQSFLSAWQQDHLPHALLIRGEQGLGKLELAEQMAAALLCQNNPQKQAACGQCASCHLFQQGHHLDYQRIQAEKEQITVDQVRQMIAASQTKVAHYRIFLIAPAEAMNLAASNALLKLLEEPNANHLFLLVSHRAERLLPTLRSRCQILSLAAPPQHEALHWLQKQGFDIKSAQQALLFSQGAPLQARRLLKSDQLTIWQKIWQTLQQGPIDPLQAEDWLKENSFNAILNLMRLCLIQGVWQSYGLSRQSQRFNPQHAQILWLQLEEIAGQQAINGQIALENLLISWSQLFEE